MRAVSSALLSVITGPHSTRVRIRRPAAPGWQGVEPEIDETTEWEVIGGTLRMESSAVVRSTLDVELWADWDTLLPDGREMFVEYGVEMGGGAVEWVSLGYFTIDTVTQESLNGPIRVTASDRMGLVEVAESPTAWVFAAGLSHRELFSKLLWDFSTNRGGAIAGGTTELGDDIVFDYDADTTTTSLPTVLDKPMYEILQDVCTAHGKRMFFDSRGVLNVVDEVVDLSSPDYTIKAGPGGILRGMSRQMSRDGTYYWVRVESSAPTEGIPPNATRYVDSFIDIPQTYPKILRRFSSPLVSNSTEALAAATTIAQKMLGLPINLSLTCAPNPALEPLDVVTIEYPAPGPSGALVPPGTAGVVQEVHAIDSLTFSLTGGEMAITTRDAVIEMED